MRFKLSFPKVRYFILTVFIIGISFAGGYYFGVQGYKVEVSKALQVKLDRTVPLDKNVDFSLFWQVWDTLSSKYYDKSKLVPAQMVYGAIEGMVSALGDPYSMFLPPTQNRIVNEDLSGSFEGVGIEIGYKDSRLAVVSPLPGSPADKAGIKPGDFIIHLKDVKKNLDIDTPGLSLAEAVANIRGSAGTKISLTLIRDGEPKPIVVELTRAKLDVPSVVLAFVGKNSDVAHVRVVKFSAETPGEWDKAVKQMLEKPGLKGMIVDLRNDPGGYLQGAVDLASDFLNVGTTVVIQEDGNGVQQDYKTQKFGRLLNTKVVILINEGSASASEIFSGALRDQKGVKLIGEKSFGKGTVQEPIDVPGGSGLHVTTSKWLTPKGIWVHLKGLEPDIAVSLKEEDKEDTQLQKAIELIENQ